MRSMDKYVLTDIDGCLTRYPFHFLKWVKKETGVLPLSLVELKASMSKKDYESLKYRYRISGVKRNLPLIHNAKMVLQALVKQGYKLYIYTSRPKWDPVYSDTKYWLAKNNIPYSKLFFLKDKIKLFEKLGRHNFEIIVDDDYELLKKISLELASAKTFYLDEKNGNKVENGVYKVNSWKSIGEVLNIC